MGCPPLSQGVGGGKRRGARASIRWADARPNLRVGQQSLGWQRDPHDTFYRDRGHALMASMEKASADIHTGRDVMIAKHPKPPKRLTVCADLVK